MKLRPQSKRNRGSRRVDVYSDCVADFDFRAEETGSRSCRRLDGYNPLPECVEQWQLSCWYASRLSSNPVLSPSPRAVSFLSAYFPDKKKKKEESKVPVRDVKEKTGDEEKKKEKPKAHAPSHAKIRSIGTAQLRGTSATGSGGFHLPMLTVCLMCSAGFEMETPNPTPPKKTPSAPQLGNKYNIKPPLLKRPR